MIKAISIFLSLLLLASSSGVAYAQHFCGGMEMLSTITLAAKGLSCGMELSDTHCDDTTKVSEEEHCCENHITQIQTDDDFAKAGLDIKFENSFIAEYFSVFELGEVPNTSEKITSLADYSPPPIVIDLCILYDSFLI